jgi:hypothetical protein
VAQVMVNDEEGKKKTTTFKSSYYLWLKLLPKARSIITEACSTVADKDVAAVSRNSLNGATFNQCHLVQPTFVEPLQCAILNRCVSHYQKTEHKLALEGTAEIMVTAHAALMVIEVLSKAYSADQQALMTADQRSQLQLLFKKLRETRDFDACLFNAAIAARSKYKACFKSTFGVPDASVADSEKEKKNFTCVPLQTNTWKMEDVPPLILTWLATHAPMPAPEDVIKPGRIAEVFICIIVIFTYVKFVITIVVLCCS